jgi:RHS repeat-associated protein
MLRRPQGCFGGRKDKVGYTEDGDGRLLNDGAKSYLWEMQGWLCGVTSAGNHYQYIYDAEGRLVTTASRPDAQCGLNTTTLADYIVDQFGRQITEADGSANWRHTNVYANGELLATYDGVGLHYALNDWLGDKRVQALASSTGTTVEETCWNLPFNDGFGCSGTGTDATEQHYTGKEHDKYASQLDHLGARSYTGYSGRFLSPDDPDNDRHLGDPQSLNLYTYGRNNPLKNIDPDGETCQTNSSDGTVYDDNDGQGCSQIDNSFVAATVTAQPGNAAVSLALNGLMALSNMAGDYFAGLTGLRAYPNDQLSKDWTGTASNIGVNVAGLMVGPEGEAGEAINVTEKGLQHVLERHTVGGAKSAGKSLFNAGTDIKALVKAAESKAPETLPNGDLRFTVDAGQNVGVNRATGQATSQYTVVTDSSRNLITAHPGSYQ